jgi:hypothetical protein
MLIMVVITIPDLTSPYLLLGGLYSCQAAIFNRQDTVSLTWNPTAVADMRFCPNE